MSKIKEEPGMIIKKVSETKKKTPLKSAQEVAVQRADNLNVPAEPHPTDLVTVAVNKGMDIEYIKELINLKNKEEDRRIAEEMRQAEILFNNDFAVMQSEFEPVKRTKRNSQYGSDYADLPALQRQYGPVIGKHGFAYDFETTPQQDGGSICMFRLKKFGHVKVTQINMPAYKPEGKIMNPMQAVGTVISYGCRYAMKVGLGVSEEDDDTDGDLGLDVGVKYADEIRALQGCPNGEELSAAWTTIYNDLRTAKDRDGLKVLSGIYEAAKKELSK